jgi:hypothetical protein
MGQLHCAVGGRLSATGFCLPPATKQSFPTALAFLKPHFRNERNVPLTVQEILGEQIARKLA